MYALEFALAVIFITTPADKLETGNNPEFHDFLGPRIAALARQWELLDPREKDHFKNPIEFVTDLKVIHDRYQNLRDAPTLSEVERFPNLQLVNELIASNRRYQNSLLKRWDLSAEHLATILAETFRVYRVHDFVRDARCEYFYIHYRRQSLAKLRDLIGPRAFAAGQLPPAWPRVNLP